MKSTAVAAAVGLTSLVVLLTPATAFASTLDNDPPPIPAPMAMQDPVGPMPIKVEYNFLHLPISHSMTCPSH